MALSASRRHTRAVTLLIFFLWPLQTPLDGRAPWLRPPLADSWTQQHSVRMEGRGGEGWRDWTRAWASFTQHPHRKRPICLIDLRSWEVKPTVTGEEKTALSAAAAVPRKRAKNWAGSCTEPQVWLVSWPSVSASSDPPALSHWFKASVVMGDAKPFHTKTVLSPNTRGCSPPRNAVLDRRVDSD